MLTFKEKGECQVSYKGEDLTRDENSATRLLFLHPDFVVKIDTSPNEKFVSRQSAREIDFWETLREDKEHFAELLEWGKTPQGFWYVKQRWYEPDDVKCTPQNLQTLRDLIWKYNLHDITEDWTDGSGNWMIHKGEVLIYDWGCYGG